MGILRQMLPRWGIRIKPAYRTRPYCEKAFIPKTLYNGLTLQFIGFRSLTREARSSKLKYLSKFRIY